MRAGRIYSQEVVDQFWGYRKERFSGMLEIFDRVESGDGRPPVFRRPYQIRNVLVDPTLGAEGKLEVENALPVPERHRWFGSMKSSQALVQSVFGNLRALRLCSALGKLRTEEGDSLFDGISDQGLSLQMEYQVTALAERRPTSVDVWIAGPVNLAVECKFAEVDVGQCSRPKLDQSEPDYCSGAYQIQKSREVRCALTELGIHYWRFVPQLFHWSADLDHAECPLRSTYQLIRNVLAGSIDENGSLVPGVAILVYDERNPAFSSSGAGGMAFDKVKAALIEPKRLQRLSWQRMTRELSKVPRLSWLVAELNAKYGI